MAKKSILIKPTIEPFEIKMDPTNPEPMRDTIARATEIIIKELAERLVVNVGYTSAGMLADMRKCHANGVGASVNSRAAALARKKLTEQGVQWKDAHLDDSRLQSPVVKGNAAKELKKARAKAQADEQAKAQADEQAQPAPAKAADQVKADTKKAVTAARVKADGGGKKQAAAAPAAKEGDKEAEAAAG